MARFDVLDSQQVGGSQGYGTDVSFPTQFEGPKGWEDLPDSLEIYGIKRPRSPINSSQTLFDPNRTPTQSVADSFPNSQDSNRTMIQSVEHNDHIPPAAAPSNCRKRPHSTSRVAIWRPSNPRDGPAIPSRAPSGSSTRQPLEPTSRIQADSTRRVPGQVSQNPGEFPLTGGQQDSFEGEDESDYDRHNSPSQDTEEFRPSQTPRPPSRQDLPYVPSHLRPQVPITLTFAPNPRCTAPVALSVNSRRRTDSTARVSDARPPNPRQEPAPPSQVPSGSNPRQHLEPTSWAEAGSTHRVPGQPNLREQLAPPSRVPSGSKPHQPLEPTSRTRAGLTRRVPGQLSGGPGVSDLRAAAQTFGCVNATQVVSEHSMRYAPPTTPQPATPRTTRPAGVYQTHDNMDICTPGPAQWAQSAEGSTQLRAGTAYADPGNTQRHWSEEELAEQWFQEAEGTIYYAVFTTQALQHHTFLGPWTSLAVMRRAVLKYLQQFPAAPNPGANNSRLVKPADLFQNEIHGPYLGGWGIKWSSFNFPRLSGLRTTCEMIKEANPTVWNHLKVNEGEQSLTCWFLLLAGPNNLSEWVDLTIQELKSRVMYKIEGSFVTKDAANSRLCELLKEHAVEESKIETERTADGRMLGTVWDSEKIKMVFVRIEERRQGFL